MNFDLTLSVYQLIGQLFTLIIPFGMLLTISWVVIKTSKAFIRSIKK